MGTTPFQPLTQRRSARAIVLVALVLLIGAWVVAWYWDGFKGERLGQVGEAFGPIVGALSLFAVFAALDSVRVQVEALSLQRVALDEQRAALRDESDVQRRAVQIQGDALEAQHKALQTEITAQRHTALGSAYARLYGAVEVYREAVTAYLTHARAHFMSDRAQRAAVQMPVTEKYEQVRLANWAVSFVDPDPDRERLRKIVIQRFALEPSGGDTPERHRTHVDTVIQTMSTLEKTDRELRQNLFTEMGFRDSADAPDQAITR